MMLSNTPVHWSRDAHRCNALIQEKNTAGFLDGARQLVNEYPDCGFAWQMISEIAAAMGIMIQHRRF
jgi:hypothetical protein